MRELKRKYVKLNKDSRLYGIEKPIIALTGGIATGKSTARKIIEGQGISVIDADNIVKKIYQTEEAKSLIQKEVKDAWKDNEINFKLLREIFFSNQHTKIIIENFIYSKLPYFFREEIKGITNQNFYVYDVPLLFEKKLQNQVDLSILIYSDCITQKERLINRDLNSPELAQKIIDQQLDIESKKNLADFVIDNSGSLEHLSDQIITLFKEIQK